MGLDAQRREQLIDRLTRRIAKLGMIAPAILFLEAYKPLSFIGAQMLWATQPFLSIAFNAQDLSDLAALASDEAGTESLIARLEALQAGSSSVR